MRIIAGDARGRKLNAPEGLRTRPSSDRLKEAMFGSIQFNLHGAIVLDLFSGSGALGLEAISRGAEKAYCNDSDEKSVRCITENMLNLGYSSRVQIGKMDYTMALRDYAGKGLVFDYIFLDPPYDTTYATTALKLIAEKGLSNPSGLVFWEYERELAPETTDLEAWGYEVKKNKYYGKAGLIVLQTKK